MFGKLLRQLLIVLATTLGACSAPSGSEEAGRQVFDLFRAGKFEEILAKSAPALWADGASKLAEVRALLPSGEPDDGRVIGLQSVERGLGDTEVTISHEYRFPTHSVVATTMLYRVADNSPWTVLGFHIQVLSEQDLKLNDFSFSGKSVFHYAFLMFVIATAALIFIAIVLVVRSKGLKRKWLWILAALATVGSFSMNWTTGDFAFQPLHVAILGIGITKLMSPLAPWVLQTAAPVGAIVVLVRLFGRARDTKRVLPDDNSPT